MAKVVDITEKLSFGQNPKLKIKDKEFEVQSDAKTMLEIMGMFGSGNDTQAALGAYEKLFTEKDRKTIEDMRLPFADLMVIITGAMELVQGSTEEPGE